MLHKLNIDDNSELYLVGFRIDSDNERGVDFYTLYLDSERPIDCDGYPILFFKKNDMEKALNISNCGCNHLALPSPENFSFIDIAHTLYEIGECNVTDNANILDCLNMLWDFISFFHEDRIHNENKKIIRDAANYFTFNYDIESYFKERNITRTSLVQAIEWVVGATAMWAKYIHSSNK